MQKLFSEFNKILVVSKQEKAAIGFLRDVILNPDDGKAVGISFATAGGDNKIMVARASAIVGAGLNFIMLRDTEAVGLPDEIIRVKEVMDKGIEIVGSKVVDEDGRNMGKANNYSVNLKTLKLERLYVLCSNIVKLIAKEIIIPEEDIIKIEKGKITVRSGVIKESKSVNVLAKEPQANS